MGFYKSPSEIRKERKQKRINRKPELLAEARRNRRPLLPQMNANAAAASTETVHNESRVKSVLRYTMMPEILPRIRALGFHFGHFAYLLALVFASARLIPQNHPALNQANIGRFGVRQIIAIAANNITWSKNNIDQIAIFSAIIIGIIMIAIQAVLIAATAVIGVGTAEAQTSFFTPTDTEYVQNNDVALIFLSQVFGTDIGLFNVTTVDQTIPVQAALRAMLSFYSMAMMVVAVIIVLYFIMTVVGEAAKTGTPFGQRFNSLWAPIRLVVALGLLVPLGNGLNSAQYITLYAAEMGSGLATNAWSIFAREITNVGDVVSRPDSASAGSLVSNILGSEVCMASYNRIETTDQVQLMQNVGGTARNITWNANAMSVLATGASMPFIELVWTNKPDGGRIRNRDRTCGFFTFNLSDFDVYNDNGTISTASTNRSWWSSFWGPAAENKIGQISSDLKQAYLTAFKDIAEGVRPVAEKIAECKVSINPPNPRPGCTTHLAGAETTLSNVAISAFNNMNTAIQATFATVTGSASGITSNDAITEMVSKGWGAAGLWFANIGKINQYYHENINISFPTQGTITNIENNDTTAVGRRIRWTVAFLGLSNMDSATTAEIDIAVNFAYEKYGSNIYSAADSTTVEPGLYEEIQFSTGEYTTSESGFARFLFAVFGAQELYDMRSNPTLDPMARLMSAGSTMVERSMISATIAVTVWAAGKVAGKVAKNPIGLLVAEIAESLWPLILAFAGIGLVVGAMLFYVIPVMPFIYFAFAVMGWILEIFEAIIAMPLWALAHLRIDGDGMPGQAAIQGYSLIFMILLRPVLIVFGLIGGYIIFGGCVYFLTSLYDMAVGVVRTDINSGGGPITSTAAAVFGNASPVGALGLVVYTLIYTFLVYNIAIMSFKMIDDVPKGILRWLGVGAQSFGDSRQDPIGGQREVLAGAVGAGVAIKSGLSGTSQAYSGIQREKIQDREAAIQQGMRRADLESKGKSASDIDKILNPDKKVDK